MVNFMIIGAPRSGTAWASAWLTTERTLCHHDVLFNTPLEELDSLPCDRILGIADTGIWLFPEFLKRHPAKKVILHRDPREIDDSLRRAGLPPIERNVISDLHEVEGLHVDWRLLFAAPHLIHTYLFGSAIPFDEQRHALLCKLNVQVDFEKIDPDPAVTRVLLDRIAETRQ